MRIDKLQPYRFVRGTIDDLARLPPMRDGALPQRGKARPEPAQQPAPANARPVPRGRRHPALLQFALSRARACETIEALRTAAETYAMTELE